MSAYVNLPGTGTTRINTPDSAALSLLGDLDVRVLVAPADWTPAAAQNLTSHWNTTGNVRSWQFTLNTTGTLFLQWSTDGTATITSSSTVGTGFSDGTAHWLRVTHDVDNGAAGNDVIFYTSNDPTTTAPGSVSWTQLGTTVTTAGTTSHFNSTTLPALGATSSGSAGRLIGKMYYAEWRSSIGGTIVASPDFRDATQITTPYTVFTDPQANAWTLQTAATWIFDGTGTGASTLAGVTSAGSGTLINPITGTGALTLVGVTSAGVATVGNPITGTGSSTLVGVLSAASGVFTVAGSGSGNRMGIGRAIRKPPRLTRRRRR